ncbi:uncharacterized protein [Prorops nasuta]|uniref:uncharacterized protein n=1 Tax=Prorops nasuta TaxID=863751 RepID=UPI0034CEFA9C
MTTAMARLPCKQTSPTHQPRTNANFANGKSVYWDMQPRNSTSYYIRSHHQHADHTGKRKSAVELLQESKAFYVKSEIVLDRKQELKNSGHLQVSQLSAPGAPPRLLRKCTNNIQPCSLQPTSPSQLPISAGPTPCCWNTCHEPERPEGIVSPQQTLPPTLPPKSPRLVHVPQRRTISGPPSGTGSDQLQTALRLLLNTDSKENVFFPESPTRATTQANNANGSQREEKYRYSPGNQSTGCREEERLPHRAPTDVRFKFGRSNSHSHTTGRSERKSTGSPSADITVCHKSLPDLHKSTRRRASLSPRATSRVAVKGTHYLSSNNCPDCDTCSDYSEHSFKRDSNRYRSSRHIRRSLGSGGGDASSVLSSGGRTQKSSGSSKLSHGAARDSGGSSGHCTHRSEPPPRIQDCYSHVRRDSGASTQHSTEKDRSRKGSYVSGTPPLVARHYSPESDSRNSQADYSPTCNSRFSDGWNECRGRPILRSKSDISDRYSRQDNTRSNKSSRPPRSMTQLENFFDRLGLNSDNYHQLITESDTRSSSPVFFDSVSSVDSALGLYSWVGSNREGSQWQNNNCSTGMGNEECIQRVSEPPNIVERNARIIKWLCQCRKVQLGYS